MMRRATAGGADPVNNPLRTSFARWRNLALVSCLAAASFAPLDAADARTRYRSYDRPKKKVEAPAPAPLNRPLFFVVNIGKQRVTAYSNDGIYAQAPISSGSRGHATPTGIFNIIQKNRHHRSNIYSGAPMPFMQRLTWSGVAMHQGALPGYPASHGCIRLPYDFASRMFNATEGTERVIVAKGDVVPMPFSHAKLPEPAMLQAPGSEQIASISGRMLANAVNIAEGASATDAQKIDVKAEVPDSANAGSKLLNPREYALTMTKIAAKTADEAERAASPARRAVEARVQEQRVAATDLRKAQIALSVASNRLDAADKRLSRVGDNETKRTEAEAARAEAETKVKEAQTQIEAAERAKADKDEAAAVALKAFRQLDVTRSQAANSTLFWKRRLAPVSIFISRKTQRLYVRQNYIKVFDVPVIIRDPGKPLGTHLYMAMQPVKGGSVEGAPKLRWLSMTLTEPSQDLAEPRTRRRKGEEEKPRPVPNVSASSALDRIEIPEEVEDKISEMLWSGGSIIVSDSGISNETGEYTDFVILTR
ncbi:L,D-transpeptidase family protein [Rhodomicrobium udaipurense]|uniref:L,D-transpeptidase family protein n=1 Tax=Rhodomicrobium udaipurense TaxID=1202716 RepID=A0A8I1KIP4_9HYPH|nr:L,D-transpeptidase family protein [Rhodomicrobium udaipurense]MBJ7544930.1 L,D-transpeptidase family protein [Rhodomicrobium udaipurense]